jgi:hypothetical protein
MLRRFGTIRVVYFDKYGSLSLQFGTVQIDFSKLRGRLWHWSFWHFVAEFAAFSRTWLFTKTYEWSVPCVCGSRFTWAGKLVSKSRPSCGRQRNNVFCKTLLQSIRNIWKATSVSYWWWVYTATISLSVLPLGVSPWRMNSCACLNTAFRENKTRRKGVIRVWGSLQFVCILYSWKIYRVTTYIY